MLRLDVSAGVASVTIDNPPVNAWGEAELDDLAGFIDAIRGSEAVVAVIRGSGRHFSAGGDIKMMVEALEAGDMSRLGVFANRIQSLFLEWRGLEIPTVAVLRGAVVGGGLEMALASDLRIAAASARLGFTEVELGLLPAGGGTQYLTELLGRGPALRMMLTGEVIGAEEARALGLVQWCVPDDELEAQVDEVVGRIVARAGPVHGQMKRCVNLAGTSIGFAAEQHAQRALYASPEAGERLRAFLQRR